MVPAECQEGDWLYDAKRKMAPSFTQRKRLIHNNHVTYLMIITLPAWLMQCA
jgi:hypothetical protein